MPRTLCSQVQPISPSLGALLQLQRIFKCLRCEHALSYSQKRRENRFRGTRHRLESGRLMSREEQGLVATQNRILQEEGERHKTLHPQEYLRAQLYGDAAPVVVAQLRRVELEKNAVQHLAEAKANLRQLESTLQKYYCHHKAGPGAVPKYPTDFWPETQVVLRDYKLWVKDRRKIKEHEKADIAKRIAETLGRNDLKVVSRGPSSSKLCLEHGTDAYTAPYRHTRAAEQHEEHGLFPVNKRGNEPSTRIVEINGYKIPSFLVAGLGQEQLALKRAQLESPQRGGIQSSFHPAAFTEPSRYHGPYKPYRQAAQETPTPQIPQKSPRTPAARDAEASIEDWVLYSRFLLTPTAKPLSNNPVHPTPPRASMDSQKKATTQQPAPIREAMNRKPLPPNAKVCVSTRAHLGIPIPRLLEPRRITQLSLDGFPFEGLAKMISTALRAQRLL